MLTWQGRPGRRQVSHVELEEWREGSRTFAGFGAFRNGTMNISDARALPEQARGTWVTANTFSLLRQPALLGRDFASTDEAKGAEPVVIISYHLLEEPLWRRSARARHAGTHEWAAGDDCRRHARGHAVPGQHGSVGARDSHCRAGSTRRALAWCLRASG